jgi:hypothetical protein
MPTRDTAPVGAPCWIDLLTSNVERSRDFYSQLFGWTAEEASEEFGGYFMFTKDGVPVAGAMPNQPAQTTPVTDAWTVYLTSDDARKTVDTATDNGGQVIVGPADVGDLGTMAVLTDAGGAAIGLWQPKAFHGFGVYGEANTPAWFELHTRDYDRVVPFYREVFRWDTQVMSDSPEFRYTVLRDGDNQLAGIMDAAGFLPEGAPSYWVIYFGVDDPDATLNRITELDGSVVEPAVDTPYGRMATATDPNGTLFKVIRG